MKAYQLFIKDDDDAGSAIVFANTAREAKKLVFRHEHLTDAMGGGWIYLRCRRYKQYDGMETLKPAELALEQWKDGWWWFESSYPDPDTATDKEFLDWYEDLFGECGDNGGRSIGASHVCTCNSQKGHLWRHGCSCGAMWDNPATGDIW